MSTNLKISAVKIFFWCCLMLGFVGDISGQILTFDFAGLAGTESTANSNSNDARLTSSTISRGAGNTSSANADRFNSTSLTTSTSLDASDYYEFTITPNCVKLFSISSVVMKHQRSGTGPVKFALRSSEDSYASDLGGEQTIGDVTTTQTTTFTFTMTDKSTAVTFRIYAYAAESGAGSWGIGDFAGNDLVVNGSTADGCSIPCTQATSFSTNTITTNSMNIAFTRGNGDAGVLVVAKSGSAPTDPTNGTSYTANATYGSGTACGGGFVVYKGTAAGTGNPTGNIAISGLSSSTTYYYNVYEYNASGTCYNLIELSGNAATTGGAASASVIQTVSASEPATISSLENTASITSNLLGTQVWKFDIYDGNGTDNDGDALPTNYTSFTISQGASNTVASWTNNILDAKFFEGTNATPTAGTVSINATTIVFTPSASISVTDGAASKITITLIVSLKNPLVSGADGKLFQFKLVNTDVTTEGTGTSSQLAAFTANSDGTKNVIAVVATELRFSSVPGAIAPNSSFSSTVSATDANGNIDANSTTSVTLSRFGGTGTLSAAGGLTKSLVAGTYTWSDLQFNTEETFTIKATDAVITDGESPSIICTSTLGSVIVEWNFPATSADQYADAGIALNYDSGTPSNSKQVSVSGASGVAYTGVGSSTKCISASGWDAGSGTKYYQIECNGTGYSYLKLSSKQRSTSTGPRDWKIQYKVGAGSWTDVTSGSVTVGDNWTTGVKTDLSIPSACDNQSSLYFRWIMTSNTSVGGGTVSSAGSAKIDDIIITAISANTITTGTIAGSPFCITSATGISVTVPFTSTGTFNSGNIYSAELSDETGSFSVATVIGTLSSTANSGNISATIPAGTVSGTLYRIRVKSDNPFLIGNPNTINLTVILDVPDASGLNAVTASGQVTVGWTNPLSCFDDVLIVVKASSNVNAGTPTGDGSSYTANLAYSSGSSLLGGYVVYKAGSTSGQTITSLTNGTTYFIKIFVRKGTNWSSGIEISCVPSTTGTGDYLSTGTGGNWNAVGTWLAYNGSIWVAASDFPNSTTKNVTIQTGTTVVLNNGPYSVYNLTVENGAKLYRNVTSTSSNRYIDVYGPNLICNGIIGNGAIIDVIGFRFEGTNTTISGTGIFDAIRFKKEYSTNLTTNLIIAMDVNLRWNDVSGTQLYNDAPTTTTFNVTLNAGSTLNLIVSGAGNSGNACINGTGGSGAGGGTFTINGTMNIPGIFYAHSSNSTIPATWIIGTGGVINCNEVDCAASGTAGHTLRIMNGGKLNINTTVGFSNFSLTNNTYDFQAGSIVEYSSPTGTTTVQFTQAGFVYANLLISGNGGTKQISTSGNVQCTENLTITGGVLDANNKNITVGGNWSDYGTNGFTEGAVGTVYFNGTSAQTIASPGGEDFYNLDFTLAGTKTILDNITAHDLTINTGSGAFIANDKDISVSGNWSNYGTAGFTEGSVATVTFNGTAAQTVTCAGNENFYNLTINNSSTGVTLNNTVNAAGILTFTLGIINTGANEMRVTNNSTTAIVGYQTDISLAAYTSSPRVNGFLRRTVAATGSYDFPVGTSTNYEYSNINLSASAGISTIVSSFTTPHTGTAPADVPIYVNSVQIDNMLNYGFWTIAPNAVTSVTYSITIISHGHTNGGSVATKHTIIKRDNSGTNWATFQANHSNSTQSGTGSNPISATLSSMTGFSDFAIGLGAQPLPLTLIEFTGHFDENENSSVLEWKTANERNLLSFMVQRSSSANEFSDIGFVEPSSLNSPINNYQFVDTDPAGSVIYYRLKMLDNDGKFNFSRIINIVPSKKDFYVQKISPNPFSSEFTLDFILDNSYEVIIEVFDMEGIKIFENVKTYDSGKNKFIFSDGYLKEGIYLVKIKNGNNVYTKKVIKFPN